MSISDKTLLEMRAGATALATHQGRVPRIFDKDAADRLLSGLKNMHDRARAMERWEREGMLVRETVHNNKNEGGVEHTILHHVKNGPTLRETPEALQFGGYPSEQLVAEIALAIIGCAHKDEDHG